MKSILERFTLHRLLSKQGSREELKQEPKKRRLFKAQNTSEAGARLLNNFVAQRETALKVDVAMPGEA